MIWKKDRFYNFARLYVDFTTRCAFRRLRKEGAENLPKDGAYLLTPNHCNTLMDALIVLQANNKITAFGARADMFRSKRNASILRWLRILPLARMRDGRESLRENHKIFGEIADCLYHNVPFCLYAEGTHHVGYTVHPVKNGVFHIIQQAKETVEKKIYVVPVGLEYSDFYHYRGYATMRYGKPLDSDELLAMTPKDRNEKLTSAIQDLVSEPKKRRPSKLMKALLCIPCMPFFILSALLSCLVTIPAESIISSIKDKAWSNSIRYCCHLFGIPLSIIICSAITFPLLPWWAALGLTVYTAFAPCIFYESLAFFLYR